MHDLSKNWSELWKLARRKADGSFISKGIKEVADRIDSLSHQSSEGTLNPYGKKDVLTTALSTEEHPGRVRAAGKDATIKKYFEKRHKDRNQYVKMSDVDRIVDERVASIRQEMLADFRAKLSKIQQSEGQPGAQQPCHPQLESVNECFTMLAHISEIPTVDDTLYDLIINVDGHPVVAKAKVIGGHDGQMLHNVPLGADNVKVSISVPIVSYAAIPFPLEEITSVADAVGIFIAWPKKLVKNHRRGKK